MSERLPPAPLPSEMPEPRRGEILRLQPGDVWARLFLHAGQYATRWDRFRTARLPSPSRFDAFGAAAVDGVLYGAVPGGPAATTQARPTGGGDRSALATCLAEAVQGQRALDRLAQRSFAVAQLTRPLSLLDLASDWSTRAGAGTHLCTAPRRETSQWAVVIGTRFQDIDGVTYIPSTRPAGRAVALWSPRCREAVTSSRLLLLRTLDDPVLAGALSWAAYATDTVLLRPTR